jgi:CRISPR-associated protein Csx17
VRYKPKVELLTEVDRITAPLDRFLREFKNVPATFLSARRLIDTAIFRCSKDATPVSFSELVCALGRMERIVALRDRSKRPSIARPLLGLSPRWVIACHDGSSEVRLAAAIASIHATGKVGSVQSNMVGVSASDHRLWGKGGGEHVWVGSTLSERLGRVLVRRLLDGERLSSPKVPLEGHLTLPPQDVAPFLLGQTDDNRLEELLWGFSLVDWRKAGRAAALRSLSAPLSEEPLSRTYALLKLLHSPAPIRGIEIRKETRVAHLLAAGRVDEACRVAIHRLRVSGLNPYDVALEEELVPERLLAALLVPIGRQAKVESLVLRKQSQEDGGGNAKTA